MTSKKPKIYLAGPMVFYNDLSVFDVMKKICAHHGLEGYAPMDNQTNLDGLTPNRENTAKIIEADFALMDKMDGAVFCLDPFRRSAEMDPGTAVEIGYMKALQRPMSGWTTDGRTYPEKVRAFFNNKGITTTAANAVGGTSGIERDPDGILIHSMGFVQNGMAHGGIELAGGKVFAHKDWKEAFEAAIINLAQQFELVPNKSPYIKDHSPIAELAV